MTDFTESPKWIINKNRIDLQNIALFLLVQEESDLFVWVQYVVLVQWDNGCTLRNLQHFISKQRSFQLYIRK